MLSSASRRKRALAPALLSVCITAVLTHLPSLAQAAQTQQTAQRHYDIPTQPLISAVQQWARTSGRQVYVNDAESNGVASVALQGNYTDEQALQQLLSHSGLSPKHAAGGTIVLARAQQQPTSAEDINSAESDTDTSVTTGSLEVSGQQGITTGSERDIQGYNDVYDLDISTSYIGRAEVERYKGTTPSDLINGIPGVFSGDARNSGALDINIRGIQGPGRVPVFIDGTEQALTVWRGYNGASNRNYIDPF